MTLRDWHFKYNNVTTGRCLTNHGFLKLRTNLISFLWLDLAFINRQSVFNFSERQRSGQDIRAFSSWSDWSAGTILLYCCTGIFQKQCQKYHYQAHEFEI